MPAAEAGYAVSETEADEMEERLRRIGCIE